LAVRQRFGGSKVNAVILKLPEEKHGSHSLYLVNVTEQDAAQDH